MEILVCLGVAVLSAIVGAIATSFYFKKSAQSKSSQILKDAEEKAEMLKKEKMLQAKEHFLQLKTD